MKIRIFRPEEYVQMPWRNGGGTTRELFAQRDQKGEWLWRISVADVNSSGPFSLFPDYDRSLSLLTGKGIKLVKNSGDIILNEPFKPITFSGDESIFAELIDGDNSDFNVFWKKDQLKVEVQFYDFNQSHTLHLKSEKQTSFFIYEIESQYSHYITPEFENESALYKFKSPLLLVSIKKRNPA